jgi:recombinational DNA repair ATPase RecF
MIQIETLRIQEFRGVRDHTLTFNRKSHAICGPNGTGKSGVVDAIEFALTGDITRLSGKGRGDLSLKAHAPHVDSKHAPERAIVTLTAYVPSLKRSITIERDVKHATKPRLTPDTPATQQVLRSLEAHKEIVLSRREIIKYIVVAPGDRAREVQALLRLDAIEDLRKSVEKIANSEAETAKTLALSTKDALDEVMRVAQVAEPRPERLLEAVNARRQIVGLSPLTEIGPLVPVTDGLATASAATPTTVAKAQSVADIDHLRTLIKALEALDTGAARRLVDELLGDEDLLAALDRATFFQAGLELADGDSCPFCDKKWPIADLRKHVEQKLARLAEAKKRRDDLLETLEPMRAQLARVRESTIVVGKIGNLLVPPVEVEPLREFVRHLDSARSRFQALLPLSTTLAGLTEIADAAKPAHATIESISKAVSALPEPSVIEGAKAYLIACQQRLETYRSTRQKAQQAKARATLATTSKAAFGTAATSVLNGVYTKVRDEFVRLYRMINQEDEGAFVAKLEPSYGKLSFDVDFYGKGPFPPGAYHSEGHQDGMGLCLYLALMRYLLKDQFQLAVLDDVVMSVDTGHRRHVCRVLSNEFGGTQFILTTHDRVWLEHMKSEGLVDRSTGATHFKTWSVDRGPTRWEERDTFAQIREQVKTRDIRAAASTLRGDLEYMAGELCARLGAKVVYVADGQYDLGMMLPPATGRMKDLYKKARMAADSWRKTERVKEIDVAKYAFEAVVQKTELERWQINAAVHYNSWANLDAPDFQPVADAFEALVSALHCSKCKSMPAVTYQGWDEQNVRCVCAEGFNLDLVKKPAE